MHFKFRKLKTKKDALEIIDAKMNIIMHESSYSVFLRMNIVMHRSDTLSIC